MTLEEEITMLTAKWYKYVGVDHHKDRDCHWYVEKVWSYGEEPYYYSYHNGYILDNWKSPKCSTEELAQTLLRNRLIVEIKDAIKDLEHVKDDEEILGWRGTNKETVEFIIDELKK